MLSERPMDWTHRLFNRARSSRSQTFTDNQTVRLSLQVLLRATPASPPPTVRAPQRRTNAEPWLSDMSGVSDAVRQCPLKGGYPNDT